jgi:hypothetical protein
MAEWYYLDKRTRLGPFDEKQIARMIKTGVVLPNTLVWNSGLSGWQEAVSTNLSAYFKKLPPGAKKPSLGGKLGDWIRALGSRIRALDPGITVTGSMTGSGAAVDDRFAWGIVGVTAAEIIILIGFFSWWFGLSLVFLLLLLLSLAFLARKDVESIVASKGVKLGQKVLHSGALWGIFLPPLYLWRRAAIIGDTKRLQFWTYCAVVAICILIVIVYVAARPGYSYDADITAAVNKYISQNFLGNARCVSVTRIEKLSDTYSAYKAFMDNGKVIDINVTFARGGKFFVEIPHAGGSSFRK